MASQFWEIPVNPTQCARAHDELELAATTHSELGKACDLQLNARDELGLQCFSNSDLESVHVIPFSVERNAILKVSR